MRRIATLTRAVCFSTLISISIGAPAAADLVGFWDFNDETADDRSDNENDGEINGLEFSDDVPDGTTGGSLDVFGGGTVRVLHSDSLDIADTMTVAYWMKAENLDQTGNWNGPMGKISDPREDGGWEMQRFDDQSRIDIRIDTSDAANSVFGNLTGTFDDEWVHVAWTVDEGEWASFLDGDILNTGTYAHGDGFANESDLIFGNRGNCCDYVGLLDEIGIWDNVLSDEEIADLAAGIPPVGGGGERGDYNDNGALDAGDLDLQTQAIKDQDLAFDETGDGVVDIKDREFWTNDLKNTWMGDADLNGEFDSSDFVLVFGVGKYETGQMAGWAEGDWNADMEFNTSDFVVAFSNGGYEMGEMPGGLNPATAAVPEPSSAIAMLTAMAMLGWRRRSV